MSATATLADKALWRRDGFGSAAAWMASKTGTAVGTAIATMEMADRLVDLPVVAEAFRSGLLSEAQAREIAEVASQVPEAQEQLVEAVGKLTLRSLQEECRRVEAAAIVDEDERHRRIHRSRHIRSWVDRHGMGRRSAIVTPDELARLMGEVDRRSDEMVVDAIRGGWFEGRDDHRADALVDLARPDRAAPPGPDTMIHVVVDYDALMRGHTVAGEQCEIPGIGPIPVTLARQMSEDAVLTFFSPRASTSWPSRMAVTRSRRTSAPPSRSATPSASYPAVRAAGTWNVTTATPSTGPGSPSWTTSPTSANGITT